MPRGRPKKVEKGPMEAMPEPKDVIDNIFENKQEKGDVEENPSKEVNPNINSVEWTPFIMGKLLEDEVVEGLPKVDGLRRLVYEYVGDIRDSLSKVVQAPNFDPVTGNGCHSCVEHHLTIDCLDGVSRRYSGVADVFSGNSSDNMFSWRYSSACCETRAESRALRKALRLRNIIAADEIGDSPPEVTSDGFITPTQVNCIGMMCKRLDIDVMAYINLGSTKYEKISRFPYTSAIKLFGHIQKFQQDMTKIPPEIKGFKEGWNK